MNNNLLSPTQSSEELIMCSVSVVTFLKDCHNTITTGGGAEVGSTPLLCMLARYAFFYCIDYKFNPPLVFYMFLYAVFLSLI